MHQNASPSPYNSKIHFTFPTIELNVHVVGLFLVGSLLSTFLSYIGAINISLLNTIFSYPFLLIAPLLIVYRRRILTPRLDSLLLLAFVLWSMLVLILFGDHGQAGLVRLSVFVIYIILYVLAYNTLIQSNHYIRLIWRYLWGTVLSIVVVSNVMNPSIIESLLNPMLIRYVGILGSNLHGIISAIGLMATLALYTGAQRYSKFIYISCMPLFLLNVIISGSRASMIGIIAFFAVKNIPKFIRLSIFKKALTSIAAIGLTAMLYTLASGEALRFDAYSITARWKPILWAYSTLTEHKGMPTGLSVLAEVARFNHLDNTYLWLAIETGVIGALLVILFIITSLARGFQTLQRLQGEQLALYACSLGILTAMAIHGLFETYIFVGIQAGSLLLLISAAHINALARQRLPKHEGASR